VIKKYNVTVNGKTYQVEVEELRDNAAGYAVYTGPANLSPAPLGAAAAAPKPAPVSAPAAVSAGANVVAAPMPGTITAIKARPGDAVKRGDVLLVLEAMKMENDIMASSDGTVAAIHVSPGMSVNTGDPLVSLQ
jgi:biotin carboxyl carrier protein